MTKRTKTFEATYNYFEVGTIVTPTHNLHELDFGKAYEVKECVEPETAKQPCLAVLISVLSGERYVVSTEFLKELDISPAIYDRENYPEGAAIADEYMRNKNVGS